MKLDVPHVFKVRRAEYKLALEIVDEVLEPYLTSEPLSHEETVQLILQMKGPGYPWRYFGYKTRKELLDDPNFLEVLNGFPECFWTITPKRERETLEVIVGEQKIRTFIIPPLQLLYWQLRYYHTGNENLKNAWWSRYGFNPFCGGVNEMAHGLLSKRWRYWIDVKGYDRKVWLGNVMNRRNRFLKGDFSEERMAWLYANTVTSKIIMSNRDVVEKMAGNNSGSGMTTANNIEVGMEDHTYALICAHCDKYGILPTKDLVKEQVLNLYGDDHAGAVDEEFEFVTDRSHMEEYFSHFGLELKEFGGGKDYPVESMTFLGFQFTDLGEGVWGPMWKHNNLMTTLTYDIDRTSLEKYVSRFYSIMLLSFYHPIWPTLRDFYVDLLKRILCGEESYVQVARRNPAIQAFLKRGAPTFDQMTAFYTGLESSGHEFELYALFSRVEVDGPKKILQAMQAILPKCYERGKSPTQPNNIISDPLTPWSKPPLDLIDDGVPGCGTARGGNFKGACYEYLAAKQLAARLKGPLAFSSGTPHAPQWNVVIKFDSHDGEREFQGHGSTKSLAESVAFNQLWTSLVYERKMANLSWKRLASFLREMVENDFPMLEHYPGLTQYVFCDDAESAARLACDFKEGGFNPYGNGQSSLSRKQWNMEHKAKFDKLGLTQAQRTARWLDYQRSSAPAATKKKQKQSQRKTIEMGPNRSQDIRQIAPGVRAPRPIYRNGMSECARLYAVGVVNPFSFLDASLASSNRMVGINATSDKLPCIPNFPTIKTYRLIVFVRGTFATFATDGTGFIMMTPRRIANDYDPSVGTIGSPVFLSDGTTSQPVFPDVDTNSPAPSGVQGPSFNTPWAQGDAAIAAPMAYRVVGGGMRIRYAGTELNRGGIIHCIEEPNHGPLQGDGPNNIANYDGYFRVPVTRDWVTLVYTPVHQAELALQTESQTTALGADYHYMGMLIRAPPGNQALFEFECVSIFEAAGSLIRGATYSETDMRGFEMVQNVMKTENQLILQETGPSGIYKMIQDGAAMLTSMAPMAKAVGGLVGSMLL